MHTLLDALTCSALVLILPNMVELKCMNQTFEMLDAPLQRTIIMEDGTGISRTLLYQPLLPLERQRPQF